MDLVRDGEMRRIMQRNFTLFSQVTKGHLEKYREAKRSRGLNMSRDVIANVVLLSVFQSCRAIRVAPRGSYQMESSMARGTTWGTKSDTAASQVLYWKDTVSSHVLCHLAAEHSGTSHHRFAEV